MKKFLSMILALVLVLSMATVAFADETTTTPDGKVEIENSDGTKTEYSDMKTVTLTKVYNETNDGTTSPAETFTFSALTCTGVVDAGVGVTAANAPVPTIASVDYAAGEAGSDNKTKTITITLPDYTGVGIYTYTFTEIDGATAGVTYRSATIKLVVTVLQDEPTGKVRVAAVHTESTGAKTGSFDNEYSAGSLSISKEVTGILGDQTKDFTVKVTFTAPEGDTVREAITYVDGTETKTIAAGWTGTHEAVEITLKHGEVVTFTNIPYGVTYTVVENDYTAEADGGYDAAAYKFDDSAKTIDSASEGVLITNNKDGDIDTGITMDTVPYIVLLAVAFVGMIALVAKKRAREF